MSCQHCSAIIKGPTVNHSTQGHSIQIKGQYTCNSANVVYMLKCSCGQCYTGQTSRAIKVRLNKHKSNIRTYQNKSTEEREITVRSDGKFGETTVAQHFVEARHRVNELKWLILEQVQISSNNIQGITNKLL